MITSIIYILGISILAYLAWGVLYQLSFAILGLFWKTNQLSSPDAEKRMVVFIPAYKEDGVIVNTAKAALNQKYPKALYEIVVIADQLQQKTLNQLSQLPVILVEVNFEKSTKSKALNAVLDQMSKHDFEVAVILDADNHMATDFLQRINAAFDKGIRIIQGQRAAKNADSSIAILDGLSEAINNHILCKGHQVAGLSARLAGSGMAFDYTLFRKIMPQIDAIGGFDKELELRLTRLGEHVYYDHDAIIYDEKVRKKEHFSKQRSRWIAAQFHYASRFFPNALKRGLFGGQWDHFNKASQMLLPPRLLTPGMLGIGTLFFGLVGMEWLALAWAIVLVLNVATFLIAMPKYAWRTPYSNALLGLPSAFLQILLSMASISKANKKFIHTPHEHSEKTN